MSDALTHGVHVHVQPHFLPERSRPEHGMWFFAYTVTITNRSKVPVQLVSRHWIITDADGDIEEVKGEGVVGEQPRLKPGEAFTYTSACPLGTSLGAMHGTFQMVPDEGEPFDAEVAPFTLVDPMTLN